MRYAFLLLLVCNSLSLLAQEPASRTIEGVLLDAETREPVPYASIGVVGLSVGTTSNLEGSFSLKIPATVAARSFSIKISCVGFESEVIVDPVGPLQIKLKPSRTVLREVLVFDKTLSPEQIVRRAFSNIKKNYNIKPFFYQTFYRHYCKDDSLYGRLIEGAVDIYKRKGYKAQQPAPGIKEEVRVTQLRRSFDNTKVNSGHVPIALYSVMGTDLVAYQRKTRYTSLLSALFSGETSTLRRDLKKFTFTLEGTTEYDGVPVYRITYKSPVDSIRMNTGGVLYASQEGTLYITTDTYAIVTSDHISKRPYAKTRQLIHYRKLNGKYYPYHAMKEGDNFYAQRNFTHNYHLELITTDIKTKDFAKFKGKQPDKEALLKIDYDSVFWQHYNILKATPLEESIVKDLEARQSLSGQFKDFVASERERFFSGKEDEEKFNEFLKVNRFRPIYIDFWASWCGPCIKEFPASQRLIEQYKGRVAFVFLSLDDDIEAWRAAMKKYGLQQPHAYHFRIGPQSDAATLLTVESIPRYVLVDKRGNFVDIHAKRPGDPELIKDLERLLAENADK
jgi:thiol-disulfide isomerase/thioredoxin